MLDLSRLLPGPFCTLILADLGADVVKIEDPGAGDYLRLMPPYHGGVGARFAALNRGKRSAALNLKAPAGRDALLRMAERADVVVETFRPGVLDRLGVGYPALRARNARLVLCSISGYGQDGPYRDRAGHDLDYLAIAGVLDQMGPAGGDPLVPGVQIADVAGGALWGAVGVLAALGAVARGGAGRHVDVSMTEGALGMLLPLFAEFAATGAPIARGTDKLAGGVACYQVYRTADGKALAVGALEPKFWVAFCEAIGRAPDANDLAAPPARQAEIRAEVAAIIAGRSRAQWEEVFAGRDACVEPALSWAELEAHPVHVARRNFFSSFGLRHVRTPLGRPEAARPAPALGEHGDQVLGEYGFSPDEIAALRGAGALG